MNAPLLQPTDGFFVCRSFHVTRPWITDCRYEQCRVSQVILFSVSVPDVITPSPCFADWSASVIKSFINWLWYWRTKHAQQVSQCCVSQQIHTMVTAACIMNAKGHVQTYSYIPIAVPGISYKEKLSTYEPQRWRAPSWIPLAYIRLWNTIFTLCKQDEIECWLLECNINPREVLDVEMLSGYWRGRVPLTHEFVSSCTRSPDSVKGICSG
jgi:hypothetical protein